MNWSDFKIDTTLNIEGIIAAIAIFGAAIGFVFNLIKNWRNEYRDKKYRGTNSIILDLLEVHFRDGLSEDKLWELYCSPDTLEKRKSFNAFSPKKIKRIGFEGQLKHLQGRFLIRLTGPAHYHIDFRESSEWRRYYKKNIYTQILQSIKSEIGNDNLNKILYDTILTEDNNFYRLKDTYNYLIQQGDDTAIKKFISDLKCEETKKRNSAVELLIEMIRETE